MAVELVTRTPAVEPAAAEFLKLFADPTRRRIFLLLLRGEICHCDLAAALDVPQSLIAHHIRRLREAGLVRVQYAVEPEALASAWHALGDAFAPAQVGARVPACGTATRRS